MSEQEVTVFCYAHPELRTASSIPLSHKHRYSPSAVEAEIVRHYEASTSSLKKKFKTLLSIKVLGSKVTDFLDHRESMLKELKESSAVKSYLQYILGLESEIERNLEAAAEEKELEEILAEESEEKKIEDDQGPEAIKDVVKEFDSLLDAVSHSIVEEKLKNKGKSALHESIISYIKSFLELLDWLVEQRLKTRQYSMSKQQLQELISNIISCDVLYISEKNGKLGTGTIAIPLDLSPLRIALATMLCEPLDADVKNWNRMFSPPIFATLRVDAPVLMKPYRSLDNHPILIRIAQYEQDPEKFQEETKRTLTYFADITDPLIEKLKSLTPYGKRGTQPSFIRNYLVNAITYYVDFNPFSVENLRVMDLGCGSGSLLKDAYTKLLKDKPELAKNILVATLLNDVANLPGSVLRNVSEKEEFDGKLDIQIREGDMRDLIIDAHSKKEHFDIAFINRVFDIFGGYGVFLFEKKDLSTDLSLSSKVGTRELIPLELDHKVVAFYEYGPFTKYCRAIAFLMNLSVDTSPDTLFLPAVEMDTYKNFFSFKGRNGQDLFNNLLDVSEMVFVSVFPGSFDSVFPAKENANLFHHQVIKANAYSIIIVSKDKSLIDGLAKAWQGIE